MVKSHVLRFEPDKFQADVLSWYDENHRILPWRVKGRQKTDAYKVWLSEIMLQQTTVPAVIPYFQKFTQKWPDIKSLASAKDEEVMAAWAGLGYYARARNLLKCARVVSTEYNGKFPTDTDTLLKLPGIGPYTAAAIAAIAFGQPATVVDGNIERIVSRIFAISTPYPLGKKEIHVRAQSLFEGIAKLSLQSIKSYPQALMDIGAEVCSPKSPKCHICPVQKMCQAYRLKTPESFPVKAPKKLVPVRQGEVYWIEDKTGNILFERRLDKRMLGGMVALPTTDWDLNGDAVPQSNIYRKKIKNLTRLGVVHHVFTHFRLELVVYGATIPDIQNVLGLSDHSVTYNLKKIALKDIGLPSVFLKAGTLAQSFLKRFDKVQ